ncbi:MAG: hypothetical protein IJ141_01290 [Lachnospiraceae bacterium]|nr:hypothetical protein [Lachnospiraceae bacterium]
MRKFIKKIAASALAGAMVLSLSNVLPINAQEVEDSEELFVEEYVTDESTGDSYESNNQVSDATTGRYNKVTFATIHDENDVDYYEMEISDTSKEICIILTNIPSGCDYNVELVKVDGAGNIIDEMQDFESGTLSEVLIGNVTSAGTYYVVVSPAANVENNYSSLNYKLYFGEHYRTGGYGWIDTGYDINFGYHKAGSGRTYSDWYTVNLTNNTSIPDGALVTKFYLDGTTGNGAYHTGFYKQLRANGSGVQFADKSGGIDVMYSNDNGPYPVKQSWSFRGYVSASTYFVWEPEILIMYRYPVTVANLRFLL